LNIEDVLFLILILDIQFSIFNAQYSTQLKAGMLTVHLQNLIIHAFHGLYQGEHKAGNNFAVDLSVSYDEKNIKLERIENIISYEDLFNLVKRRMEVTTPLLEVVADSIVWKIKKQYPFVKEIKISIFKVEAPIANFQGRPGITLHKNFDD